MLIGNNWKIEADSLNITLYKKNAKPRAKILWRAEGHYATIGGALKGLVNQGIRDTELTDLKTISDKIDELYALIENATGGKE